MHIIYHELVEAIGRERRKAVEANLAAYAMDVYVCSNCLQEYIRYCNDPIEKSWRIKHIKTIIEFIEKFDNWHFRLTESCPTFCFILKIPAPHTKKKNQCILTNLPRHQFQTKIGGKLTGFVTDNPVFIENFINELIRVEQVVLEEYFDRRKLIDFLTNVQKQ